MKRLDYIYIVVFIATIRLTSAFVIWYEYEYEYKIVYKGIAYYYYIAYLLPRCSK